jgi:LD-carboxypeptidase N-terminal domain
VIHVLWGGTGAISVLPLLDFALIAANPKALMGYSDIGIAASRTPRRRVTDRWRTCSSGTSARSAWR